jgi:beta-lactamase class A
MKTSTSLLLLLLSVPLSAGTLQEKVNQLASQHNGKVAFIAKDLKTGATVAIDPDRPVRTASVIKLPIMLEAFYQVKAGKHRLDERLKLAKENQVEGSGVLQFFQPGLEPTLLDAITMMIIQSDNTATNMVIDAIGITTVNQRIEALGLKNTYLYKKVFMPPVGPTPSDQKQFGLGKTTPREMAEVMESIERCDLGDKTLCQKMISILKNQNVRTMIPRYLEEIDTTDNESAIGNKTGSEDRERNDVGIVYTKRGPIIISAFTYENQDQGWSVDNQAEQLIAKLAKTVVDEWTHNPPANGNGTSK